MTKAEVQTDEVHQLTDIKTMLAVLQRENSQLKGNLRTYETNQAIHRKNTEHLRGENLRLQNELLASQDRVCELQDKLLSLRKIVNSA